VQNACNNTTQHAQAQGKEQPIAIYFLKPCTAADFLLQHWLSRFACILIARFIEMGLKVRVRHSFIL
jgi:hypothetical protein